MLAGISERYAVLPLMHFEVSVANMFGGGGTISGAFVPRDIGKPTQVVLLPQDGSKPTVFTHPSDVYFTHVVNTYENASAVICDIVTWAENPFLGDAAVLSTYFSKKRRDAIMASSLVRWVLHTAGPLAGRLEEQQLSALGRITDFPKINPRVAAKPYCLYWAVEWRHDDTNYATTAIVRQDVCRGTRTYWYRPNAYPSEPTFVPRSGTKSHGQDEAEDAGVLLFTLLDGASGKSSLVELDARSMQVLTEADLNVTIGFTTHGEFYDGLIS